jgi:hypothetical protein
VSKDVTVQSNERYLTRMNTYRWIESLKDFKINYSSSYHITIKKIPERLVIFDEVDLIRSSIAHNNKIKNPKRRFCSIAQQKRSI